MIRMRKGTYILIVMLTLSTLAYIVGTNIRKNQKRIVYTIKFGSTNSFDQEREIIPGIFQVVKTRDRISWKTIRPMQTGRKWTFMVYLDADNNLESAGLEDFLEMSSVGSTNDVAIIVLLDRTDYYSTSYGDWKDTKLFYITSGLDPNPDNALEDWGEKNMGDPQTLVDFVSWGVQNYPAEHYAVILWDHGDIQFYREKDRHSWI